MGSDVAIKVENLGKLYRIGSKKESYKTLRDTLTEMAAAPFRRIFHRPSSICHHSSSSVNSQLNNPSSSIHIPKSEIRNPKSEYIWALKDVSFDVKHGEVVGIIGRNGAGKSTLLKILSRITEPTEGRVVINGRVGSLLEVGTGFHQELTGRENIYLNGAILGMKKAEIDRKFDEIVAFAEIEKFLDTPVKHYSSGMYVRLAFAVAAHLEPEILLVDEVLAVGDAAFQKKCLGKMGDVASEGRTVLFVSHNMAAVENLCNRCILLDYGHIIMEGATREVTARYLRGGAEKQTSGVVDLTQLPRRNSSMTPTLQRLWMTDATGEAVTTVAMGSEVTFHVQYEIDQIPKQPIVGLTFHSINEQRLFATSNRVNPEAHIFNGARKAIFSCRIPFLPLVAGEYLVTVGFARTIEPTFDGVDRAYRFTVGPADIYGTGWVPSVADGWFVVISEWTYKPLL